MATRSAASSSVSPRRFEIQACLGRGGFGEVYLAVMSRPGGVQAEVAVKVLATGVDPNGPALDRLRDEGRLLGLLNHPVVPKMIDLIVLQGRVAMVSEYVEGEDLDTCIAADGLSTRALLEVVAAVAEALDAAWHTHGPGGLPMKLVHRDIKPSNIRIGRHGQVKLLDFGVARASDIDRSSRTQGFALLGSWSYLAPERLADSDGSTVRPAADVYGLGCVLYEGIAGHRLTGGLRPRELVELRDTTGGFDHLLSRQLSEIAPVCDREVMLLLERMLAVEPSSRPTPREVARQCEEIADTLPGEALRQWARGRAWPAQSRADGPLVGRVLTEGTLLPGDLEQEVADEEEPTEQYTPMVPDDTAGGWSMESEGVLELDRVAEVPALEDFLLEDSTEVSDPGLQPASSEEETLNLVAPAEEETLNRTLPSEEETVHLALPPDEETLNLLLALDEETAIRAAHSLGLERTPGPAPSRRSRWAALWLLVPLPVVVAMLVLMGVAGAGLLLMSDLGSISIVRARVEEPGAVAPATRPGVAPSAAPVPVPAVVAPAPAVPAVAPAPAPAVAPAPAPAPAVAPAPATVVVAPAPAPAVAVPVPAPAAPDKVIVIRRLPEPVSTEPTILAVRGPVLIELRTPSGPTYRTGAQLPPGRYHVWANFGRGFIDTGLRPLAAGGVLVVTCDPVTARCTTSG